jgi:cellulose biosynthesis protein BcsQ
VPYARAATPVPVPPPRRAATWDDRGVTAAGVAGGVIAVASVRGGVGRTTVTAQLGRALARSGCRALLIDADNGGDLAAIAGARQPLALPVEELLDGEHAIEQAQVEVMPYLHVLVVAARGAIDWRALLIRARSHADLVLVDCPPGITGPAADVMAACGHLVGVVRSDHGAIAAATALMSFPQLSGVVVNLFDGRSAASVEAFQRIAAVGAPLFETTIPRADAIAAPGAADPEGPIAFLFDELADELLRACGDQ